MTLSDALHERFKELEATPPEDIFNALRHEMVTHNRVLIIWDLKPKVKRVDIADSDCNWRQLCEGRGKI